MSVEIRIPFRLKPLVKGNLCFQVKALRKAFYEKIF